MTYPIQFVSLGPGDPELITVKGLNALRRADIIHCPATQGEDGIRSRSMELVKNLGIHRDAIHPFLLPMSKGRSEALKAYDELYKTAKVEQTEGKRIAIVAEGDAGFYSSISYVYDRLVTERVPVKRIAGVPAFLAAGACGGLHVVKQEEQLLVIPGTATQEELEREIANERVIVLMKLSHDPITIKECIRNHADKIAFHYFEYVGTEKEYHTSNPMEILNRDFPYFSLMIIRPRSVTPKVMRL